MNSKDFLYKIYTDKRQRNSNYSIRAFARDLDIPSGRLTEIFNGKRSLTTQLGEKISLKLSLSEEEKLVFLETIAQDKKQKKKTLPGQEISLELFEKIFSPKAYAVLSLMETRGFRSDMEYIADKIGLPHPEAMKLIESLTAAGYISHTAPGKMKPTFASTYTSSDVPAQSIRNYHKKVMSDVIERLDQITHEERDVTAMVMAIDKTKLEAAKKKIARFRRSLSKFLESGKKTDVYNLSIQLFPLTKADKL